MVTTVDRGRWTCAPDGDATRDPVVAMRARELGRTPIVVGDRVGLVGDLTGKPDTLARIVRVEERTTVLRRTADDTDPVERLVVANAEQLVIVTAVADPVPRTGFVDRCLVAAYAGGLSPLLCLTKADLADPGPFAAHYAELELPVLVTRRDEPERLGALADALAGRVSALVGHSGVGKSTLVNALVPDADRAVGRVSGVGKGRHTTVAALALPLPADRGGWVVDTPGRALVRAGARDAGRRDRRLRRPGRRDRRLPARLRAPRTACGPRVRARHAGRAGPAARGPARRAAPGPRRVALDLSRPGPERTRHHPPTEKAPFAPSTAAERPQPAPGSRGTPPGWLTGRSSAGILPPPEPTVAEPGVEPDMHPRTVGPYTLLSVLGMGRFGRLHLARTREGRAGRGPGDPRRVRRRPVVPRLPARAGRRRLPNPQPAGGRGARCRCRRRRAVAGHGVRAGALARRAPLPLRPAVGGRGAAAGRRAGRGARGDPRRRRGAPRPPAGQRPGHGGRPTGRRRRHRRGPQRRPR